MANPKKLPERIDIALTLRRAQLSRRDRWEAAAIIGNHEYCGVASTPEKAASKAVALLTKLHELE
jgi:hypothetical protein